MVDTPSLHQRFLPLTQCRIVERLQHIDQYLFVRIALIGQRRIVRHERERFRSNLSRVETIYFILSLLQYGVALLIIAGELKEHPSIHSIEHQAFFAVLLFSPLDDGVGAFGIVGAQACVDEEISVDRGAATGKQHERQRRKKSLGGNNNAPPCRKTGGGA
ncbi:MAG: hypothetical protein JW395_1796 [Nitrospira sp.]|nr:hypothetical protein [Nitrospira sp.]